MLLLHCHHCGNRQLVGTRSILSLHNTADGRIAYVRCHEGHVVVVAYDRAGHESFTPADASPTQAEPAEPAALAATA